MEQQREQQLHHHNHSQPQSQRDDENDEFLDSIYLYCLVLYRQDKYKTCYYKVI